MIIWLFNPYGPIPGEGWREYCFTMMGRALAEAGNEVVWWTSNFSHHFKRFRSAAWKDLQVSERFCVRLVPTPGYQRNIGFERVWRDLIFSYRAYRRGKSLRSPSCIITSESPLTFGLAGQSLARFHQCPAIFHQMDLWPELIVKALPAVLRPLAQTLLLPVYVVRKRLYRRLSAATGLASAYLEVLLKANEHLRSLPHAVIYNGIDVNAFRASMKSTLELSDRLPKKAKSDIWAIFAGSLGPSYDIPTLWKAAKLLEASNSNIHIIIAGDGPYRRELESVDASSPRSRLHYIGQLPPELLAALYRKCDVGLCAYSARSNVEMPDKIYDYMAAGLPVLNSLQGEVHQVISSRRMGLQYCAGNSADLVEKLRAVSSDPSAMRMQANNSFRAGTEFDQRAQYAKMVEIVNAVTQRPPRDRHVS